MGVLIRFSNFGRCRVSGRSSEARCSEVPLYKLITHLGLGCSSSCLRHWVAKSLSNLALEPTWKSEWICDQCASVRPIESLGTRLSPPPPPPPPPHTHTSCAMALATTGPIKPGSVATASG